MNYAKAKTFAIVGDTLYMLFFEPDRDAMNPMEDMDGLGSITTEKFEHSLPLRFKTRDVKNKIDEDALSGKASRDTKLWWTPDDIALDAVNENQSLLDVAKQSLETYNQWIEGDVWGYVIRKYDDGVSLSGGKRGVVDESCWGFYGMTYVAEEAYQAFDAHVTQKAYEAGINLPPLEPEGLLEAD